jgi:hypothetical protein
VIQRRHGSLLLGLVQRGDGLVEPGVEVSVDEGQRDTRGQRGEQRYHNPSHCDGRERSETEHNELGQAVAERPRGHTEREPHSHSE